jgi:hypothetical protein
MVENFLPRSAAIFLDHPIPVNEDREDVVISVASEIHNGGAKKVKEDAGGAHHLWADES